MYRQLQRTEIIRENLHVNWLSSFRSSVAGAMKELANASSRINVQGSSKLRSFTKPTEYTTNGVKKLANTGFQRPKSNRNLYRK